MPNDRRGSMTELFDLLLRDLPRPKTWEELSRETSAAEREPEDFEREHPAFDDDRESTEERYGQ